MKSCSLCARRCQVNRIKGELGFCQAGKDLLVSKALLHFGEEPFISGKNGSGTIFFSHCSLACVYCQNYQISQQGLGSVASLQDLAATMLKLQSDGAHNINLVTPTHYVPQIIEALALAKQEGLNLPIVYNTNGYETLETLELLDGLVDIYLPDIKYSDNELAVKYSSAPRYVETNQAAIFEMFRQVGNLEIKRDLAVKGLLVRHLVLPNNLAGSFAVLDFIASLSQDIYISLMAQYNPKYKADHYKELNRPIYQEEYDQVVQYARKIGFSNILMQELHSSQAYNPDFESESPFA